MSRRQARNVQMPGGHAPGGGFSAPSPQTSGPQKNGRAAGAGNADGSARQASSVAASQASISLNSVQRWNGQPASMQIRTRARLAKTTSAYPAAYRSLSPSPTKTTARPAAWWASNRWRLHVPQTEQVGWPFGKSMRARSPAKVVEEAKTGKSARPSDDRRAGGTQ